jgi:hypothetical protein
MDFNLNNLETDRPSPLTDTRILNEIQKILAGKIDKDITDQVYDDFKDECEEYIFSSDLNILKGNKAFRRKDIIIGCTQFIDNLYMQGHVQVLKDDYKYHERLEKAFIFDHYTKLQRTIPLIISLPFPSRGDIHPDMDDILNHCWENHIPVHVDGAWVTCSKNINFDFNHPAIHSFGISLSKGLGLGWNRVGLRWHRNLDVKDSISIMNDFRMNLRVVVKIGLHFIRHFPTDYLWTKHGHRNEKTCNTFNLTPSNSIHIAHMSDGKTVGISKLINALEEQDARKRSEEGE